MTQCVRDNKVVASIMKRLLCFIILIIVFMPKIGEAKTEQKSPWVHISFLDVSIGIPPYWAIGCGRIGLGLPPPYGFGIEFTLIEYSGWFSTSTENKIGLALLTFYYVPYANWHEHESGYSTRIIYAYFSRPFAQEGLMGGEPDRYLKCGIRINWGIGVEEMPFGFLGGFEIGFYHYEEDWYYLPRSAFYLAINLSFGSWHNKPR